MEANQSESSNNEIEVKKAKRKYLEERYKRDCITFSEMSNTLNWTITIVTALFLFFIDKLNAPNSCLYSLFLIAIGLSYFSSIIIFTSYKWSYVKYKKIIDNVLSGWTEDLIDSKGKNELTEITLLTILDESIRLLKTLYKKQFELKEIGNEPIERGCEQEKEKGIDKLVKNLNRYYDWGFGVSIIPLVLVALYVLLKYFFVLP
jgi:hypothetical protein